MCLGWIANPFFYCFCDVASLWFSEVFFNAINFVKKKLKKVARTLLLSGNKTYLCRMENFSTESYREMKRESAHFVVRWFQIVGPQSMVRSVCRELMSCEHTMAVKCVRGRDCEE